MPDIYSSFLNAQAVAMAWIGAVLGPTLMLIGYSEDSTSHLVIGAAMLAFWGWTVWIGFKMLKSGAARSDIVVRLVVPSFLLVGGLALAAHISP